MCLSLHIVTTADDRCDLDKTTGAAEHCICGLVWKCSRYNCLTLKKLWKNLDSAGNFFVHSKKYRYNFSNNPKMLSFTVFTENVN